MRKMRRNWIVRGLKIALFATIFIAVFGLSVLQLWNWLMPAIFGLHPIGFGQALGLLALSWILFGGFRGRGYGGGWRRGMRERWEQMSPEQREKFRQGLEGHCGSFGPPAAETKV
jgi:hypothetical protein